MCIEFIYYQKLTLSILNIHIANIDKMYDQVGQTFEFLYKPTGSEAQERVE